MGLLFAVSLQLTVCCAVCIVFAVSVIIGVLLVLAPDVKFHPVFVPIGVFVHFGGCFGCCFVDGGDQAHGGSFGGLWGGMMPRWISGGLAVGYRANVSAKPRSWAVHAFRMICGCFVVL